MTTRHYILLLVGLIAALDLMAQSTAFPYPNLPDTLQDSRERLVFLMDNYWQDYAFEDTTQTNILIGEQGFVDYINLFQYADSAMCAHSAAIFADSISHSKARTKRFEAWMDHYLGNHDSPLRNDVTYAHLIRAFPQTPQRTFLLRQITKNQPGEVATDFDFTDNQGVIQHIHDIRSQLILLVFYDPDCDHCAEMLPKIKANQDLQNNAFRLKTVYIDTSQNPEAMDAFYLPSLPALYLLDLHKKVLVKDGSLEKVVECLHLILN